MSENQDLRKENNDLFSVRHLNLLIMENNLTMLEKKKIKIDVQS